jgi:hypothetical protein
MPRKKFMTMAKVPGTGRRHRRPESVYFYEI